MTILSFIVGIAVPTLIGWLTLSLLERKMRVLHRLEKLCMSCVLGLALSMLAVFTAHVYGGIPLNLVGFGSVMGILIIILGIPYALLTRNPAAPAQLAARGKMNRWIKLLMMLMGVFIVMRFILLATTFLLLTPTFLDDTLDNWNLRGKVFYEDQTLTLVMPGENPETSPLGVSSYPPTVPMMKAWLASIAGEWSEPLINSIHALWYMAAATLVYFALRRKTNVQWSATGALMLASLPLYTMHGTNAYADAFMSVHVLIPVSMLYLSFSSTDRAERKTYLLLSSLATGLLAGFTKNEGLLIFTPPIMLILIIGLITLYKKQMITIPDISKTVTSFAVSLIVLGLPWLTFKWMNGLTFGNAKAVSSLQIGWQENVLFSVVINTFFEANWHLLFPLLILLLVWRHKTAFRSLIVLSSFSLIVYFGQLILFMFTALSVEALRQTGYARGIVQLAPVLVLLTALLLADGVGNPLAQKREIAEGDL